MLSLLLQQIGGITQLSSGKNLSGTSILLSPRGLSKATFHLKKEWGIYRETDSEKKIWVGPPKLTRFERARIVGARALQIAMGAPVLIEPSKKSRNPIDIAIEELERGILPMTIRRTLPDEVTYQDIPLKWLL